MRQKGFSWPKLPKKVDKSKKKEYCYPFPPGNTGGQLLSESFHHLIVITNLVITAALIPTMLSLHLVRLLLFLREERPVGMRHGGKFMHQIISLVQQGDIEGALKVCTRRPDEQLVARARKMIASREASSVYHDALEDYRSSRANIDSVRYNDFRRRYTSLVGAYMILFACAMTASYYAVAIPVCGLIASTLIEGLMAFITWRGKARAKRDLHNLEQLRDLVQAAA